MSKPPALMPPIRADNNLAALIVSRNDVTMLYDSYPNVPVERWLITDLSGCSLNAPLAWKQAYLAALAPYTLHTWRDGSVTLVELGPALSGAPTEITGAYSPC